MTPPAATTPTAPPGRSMPYQPALDGVRAVAVALVVLFHLRVPGADGGYLGVSVFFTLSGFLITRLLLTEVERTGTIDVGAFVVRRLRRLLPAALAGLALVIVLAASDAVDTVGELRRGIWAALAQIYNWYELGRGVSYAELFVAPSPIAHYWSLAIEEQFYWCWPATLLVALHLTRRRATDHSRDPSRRLLTVVVVAFVATAVSAPLTAAWWSSAAVYTATWARAAEILAGAVIAVLAGVGVPIARLSRVALPSALALLAIVAVTPSGHGWAYEGGLPLFGVASAVVIASLQGPSVVRSVLSRAPVVWVGRRSYGIYVYHWPIILFLDADRVGLDGWRLGLVRVVVTVTVAAVSYRVLEQPVRTGVRFTRPAAALPLAVSAAGALAATALLAPGAVVTPAAAPPLITAPVTVPIGTAVTIPTTSAPTVAAEPAISAPGQGSPAATSGLDQVSPAAPAPTAVAADPTVIAIFGDSVPAWLLRDASPTYDRTDVVIVDGAQEACDGFDGDLRGRDRRGEPLVPPADCERWPDSYPAVLAQAPALPDVAVLMLGITPTVDQFVDGAWRHPCDGIAWYTADVLRRIDYLAGAGVPTVFALPARPGRGADWMLPDDYRERYACVRTELAAALGARHVAIIDLDERLCPDDRCDEVRSDGVHVRPELAPEVLDWLLDEVLQLLPISPSS